MGAWPLAYVVDLGWFKIGPPYIYLNINPIIVQLGSIALRWYGLMYVVGIVLGIWAIQGYTKRKGIDPDMVYRVLWWCIPAGIIGGRLYFVLQQPDIIQNYILKPWRILATWEGGMAFYGAIFLVIATLIWRARKERVNPLVLIDAGVLFASVGQIFGRIGNIINGDIIGYTSTLPWSTVYTYPGSWACQVPTTCNVPVQPAAAYEMLMNIVLAFIMFYLARRVRRPGILMLVYLYAYAITQFLIFFVRANDQVKLFGVIDLGLKQAQWTSIFVFIALLPITYWVLHHSQPVPEGEPAATYGIPQESAKKSETVLAEKTLDGEEVNVHQDGTITHEEPEHAEVPVTTREEPEHTEIPVTTGETNDVPANVSDEPHS